MRLDEARLRIAGGSLFDLHQNVENNPMHSSGTIDRSAQLTHLTPRAGALGDVGPLKSIALHKLKGEHLSFTRPLPEARTGSLQAQRQSPVARRRRALKAHAIDILNGRAP